MTFRFSIFNFGAGISVSPSFSENAAWMACICQSGFTTRLTNCVPIWWTRNTSAQTELPFGSEMRSTGKISQNWIETRGLLNLIPVAPSSPLQFDFIVYDILFQEITVTSRVTEKFNRRKLPEGLLRDGGNDTIESSIYRLRDLAFAALKTNFLPTSISYCGKYLVY